MTTTSKRRPDMAHKLRTLIVDDSLMNRRILDRVLRKHFSDQIALDSIHHACDGIEALALLGKMTFDLVLLDIDMPRLGGVEVCRRQRRHRKDERTLIVACTTSDEPEKQITYTQAGTDGCVGKPLVLPALRAAINTARLNRWGDMSGVDQETAYQAALEVEEVKVEAKSTTETVAPLKRPENNRTLSDVQDRLMWMDLGGIGTSITSPRISCLSSGSMGSLPASRSEDGQLCYFTHYGRGSVAAATMPPLRLSPDTDHHRSRQDSITTEMSDDVGDYFADSESDERVVAVPERAVVSASASASPSLDAPLARYEIK